MSEIVNTVSSLEFLTMMKVVFLVSIEILVSLEFKDKSFLYSFFVLIHLTVSKSDRIKLCKSSSKWIVLQSFPYVTLSFWWWTVLENHNFLFSQAKIMSLKKKNFIVCYQLKVSQFNKPILKWPEHVHEANGCSDFPRAYMILPLRGQ